MYCVAMLKSSENLTILLLLCLGLSQAAVSKEYEEYVKMCFESAGEGLTHHYDKLIGDPLLSSELGAALRAFRERALNTLKALQHKEFSNEFMLLVGRAFRKLYTERFNGKFDSMENSDTCKSDLDEEYTAIMDSITYLFLGDQEYCRKKYHQLKNNAMSKLKDIVASLEWELNVKRLNDNRFKYFGKMPDDCFEIENYSFEDNIDRYAVLAEQLEWHLNAVQKVLGHGRTSGTCQSDLKKFEQDLLTLLGTTDEIYDTTLVNVSVEEIHGSCYNKLQMYTRKWLFALYHFRSLIRNYINENE